MGAMEPNGTERDETKRMMMKDILTHNIRYFVVQRETFATCVNDKYQAIYLLSLPFQISGPLDANDWFGTVARDVNVRSRPAHQRTRMGHASKSLHLRRL